MKVNLYLLAGILNLALAAPAFADSSLHYTMDCGTNGELAGFQVKPDAQACAGYTTLGMKCGDSRTSNSDGTKLSLRSPLDTYYSNRGSSSYDRAYVKQLIADAVKSGADPYLVLAITMVEGPPTDGKNIEYLSNYGAPPLDAIGAISTFHCHQVKSQVKAQRLLTADGLKREASNGVKLKLVKKVKAGEQVTVINEILSDPRDRSQLITADEPSYLMEWTEEFGRPSNGGKTPTIFLLGANGTETEELVAQIGDTDVGGHAMIDIQPKSAENTKLCNEGCCAELRVPKATKLVESQFSSGIYGKAENPTVYKALSKAMGFSYIDTLVDTNSRLSFVKGKKSALERFASIIQGYNGYGVFGASEKMTNQCLSGLNMKTAPVYGAGVADIMLNVLMANSEIREMVEQSQENGGRKGPKSYLCQVLGEGSQEVDSKAFANLQKKYLSGRPCGGHSFSMKTSDSLGQPTSVNVESTK